MRTAFLVLLFTLLAWLGVTFVQPMCACGDDWADYPAIDLNTVSIHTVQYGTMPFHTRGHGMVSRIGPKSRKNTLFMERGTFNKENADVPVFLLAPDKKSAMRVTVHFGAIASEMIEIKSGLRAGDKVIVTDMDRWIEHRLVRIE